MNLARSMRLWALPRALTAPPPRHTRRFSSLDLQNLTLEEAYQKTKAICESKKLPSDVNISGVFACNELDLQEVQVYGFDYDYTLAVYKRPIDFLLYDLGVDNLIKHFKYPTEIKYMKYEPHFAIRGLHYDIEKGLLLKLDSFLQIQLGTVYRGLSPVSDEEVLRLYKNKTVPLHYVETNPYSKQKQYHSSKMIQLADLFSVPEMSLLCNVAEYLEKKGIDYHPEILFWDVKNSVGMAHPRMHKELESSMSGATGNCNEYLECNPNLRHFFEHLKSANKKLFLVTNSPFKFVNKGMELLVGVDWEKFFDVIIVQARKPKFFTDESRPLRIFDKMKNTQLWDRVTKIERNKIYFEGTINQLQDLTGWRGSEVLYFGDHPYSDLADATLAHGWRTGAIIQELTHEINTLNTPEYKKNCNWLQMLTQLIEEFQESKQHNAKLILATWLAERDKIRQEIKIVFNKQFGSVFRTYHNPTYFSRRLFRFADIYTSDVTNLLNYSTSHIFYPRRGVMPHEYTSYFV